jgi:uncharacterized protein (TIGR02145 family)
MKIKITILHLAILVLLFTLPACKNDENIVLPVMQNISFSFEQKEVQILSSARQKVAALKADARYVVVTIENSTGTKIYDAKKLELFNFNGSFISESLSLEVAEYKLTGFMVLDVNNTVIYSTPLEGSSLATQVGDPLPISFTVSKDQETKITPDVLTTTGVSVSDFGYASFDFDIMVPFRILAQSYEATASSWESTIANISIVGINTKAGTLGDCSLYKGTLTKGSNVISIKDGYPYYGIYLSKASYTPQFIILTNAQLKAYLNTPVLFSLVVDGTVTDVEGNVYKTVTIGTQTWMAENLKVTKYRDGTDIPYWTGNAAGWYVFGSEPDYSQKYGKLYNWFAVSDSRKIAPLGWHVASDAEWTKLTSYFPESNCAKSLASTTDWATGTGIGTIGCNMALNNSSGFCALPAGFLTGLGSFGSLHYEADWWTSDGWAWMMFGNGSSFYSNDMAHISTHTHSGGHSVRCVKDN